MCGIVGYTGGHAGAGDSGSGLATAGVPGIRQRGAGDERRRRELVVRKRAGRVRSLEELLETDPAPGCSGISHTRWATHGPATDRNAHPHVGGRSKGPSVALVHNGVIENHASLRRELESQGFPFRSQTDTEVVAHLIARELESGCDLFDALQRALEAAGGDLWARGGERRAAGGHRRRTVWQPAGRGPG